MEVYAGFLAHTDAQVGRLIDALEDARHPRRHALHLPRAVTTAPRRRGRCTAPGAAPSFQNGVPEDPEWLLEHIDDFGSARCENHYNAAWAWALDSPFQWMKQVASHFGGTRNGLAISWPNGFAARGEQRTPVPSRHRPRADDPRCGGHRAADAAVNGIEQKPIEGVSMRYTFDDGEAAEHAHDAVLRDPRQPRDLPRRLGRGVLPRPRAVDPQRQPAPFGDEHETWELYDVGDDFSQADRSCRRAPGQARASCRRLFDERGAQVRRLSRSATRPSRGRCRTTGRASSRASRRFTLHRRHVRLPELASVNLKNTSFDDHGPPRRSPRQARRG